MISVWREGDEWVASDGRILVHTFGATPEDAVRNLEQAMRVHLAELDGHEGRLSRTLQRHREMLREMLGAGWGPVRSGKAG